MLITLNVTQ